MTISEARRQAADILNHAPMLSRQNASATRDSLVLLAHSTGQGSTWLLSHAETELETAQTELFFQSVHRRSSGEPVAYITGVKEFWSLPFRVNPDVLIPKPDTETLVEKAIGIIRTLSQTMKSDTIQVLDVCTGSGCVAVSILHDCPGLSVTALDISAEALNVARVNAGLVDTPISLIQGDLRDGLPPSNGPSKRYHLIVSNPPYVPTEAATGLLEDGRGEPLLALDGGPDGLSLIRPLIDGTLDVLAAQGAVLIETGEYNARETADYLKTRGFVDIVIHQDLEGQDRVVEGRQP